MMKNVVIIIERKREKKKRVESFPIPNRTDIGICWVVWFNLMMKRKRIPFLFFFLFYSCCNHDRHMLYVRMRIFNEMLSQTNERANEKNSFVFFLFHFFFVSLCFVLWLSFRLENNESRSIHGYFIRHTHTHTEREFKWARSSYSHGLRKRQDIRDDAHEMKKKFPFQ
jgi:hypothetical protein